MSIILAFWSFFQVQANTATFEKSTPSVCFRWNNSRYDPTYRQNAAAVDSLNAAVESIGLDNISYVEVCTYASPEGVYERNMQLARERTREVRWLLKQKAPTVASKLRIRSMGEGWAFLYARVQADTRISAKSRQKILAILDNKGISDDTRKWRLEHWLGSDPNVGDLWTYLINRHFSYLRCCTITVHYSKEMPDQVGQDEKVAEPAPVVADTAVASEPQPVVAVAAKPLTDSVLSKPSTPDSTQLNPVTPSEPDTYVPRSEGQKEQEAAKANEMPDQAGHDGKVAEAPVAPAKAPKQRLSLLGVSTNLLYDICYIKGYGLTSIPSFSLEYYPKQGHWTLGADVEWPMWQHYDTYRFLQINNVTLWGRRYFKARENEEARYAGAYLLASANIARYGIGWDKKGWKGEALGLSGGIGWKHYFGRSRFYFDTGVALGLLYSRYDPYVWGDDITDWFYYDYTGDPDEFHKRRMALAWLGPTRAYISIGFDITRLKK
ncbi:MAG: hypothetical protein J5632_04295 [Bacteroidales bacterium]|nr:hypothetical protein [Bacteroidales bacterium]